MEEWCRVLDSIKMLLAALQVALLTILIETSNKVWVNSLVGSEGFRSQVSPCGISWFA